MAFLLSGSDFINYGIIVIIRYNGTCLAHFFAGFDTGHSGGFWFFYCGHLVGD